FMLFFFFFQAEDGIRDFHVTGVQTCALPIYKMSILHIPKDFYVTEKVDFLSHEKPSLSIEAEIKDTLNSIIKDKKYETYGITKDVRRSIQSNVSIQSKEIKDGEIGRAHV